MTCSFRILLLLISTQQLLNFSIFHWSTGGFNIIDSFQVSFFFSAVPMPWGSEDGEIIVVTSILGYTMGCPEVMSGIRLGAPVHQCGTLPEGKVRDWDEKNVVGSNFRSFDTLILLTKKNRRNDYIGVSKNSGIPKWMVYNGKPY